MPLVKIDTETTTVRKETPDHQVMCSPYSKPPINIAQVILSPDFHGFPSQPTKQHSNSRYGHRIIILHTFPRPPVVRLKARGHNMKLLLLLVKSKFIFCVVLYMF